MKLIFKKRKRKKTNRDSLRKVIDSTLTHHLIRKQIDSIDLEVVLKKFDKCADSDSNIQPYGLYPLRKFTININNTLKIWKIKQCLRHELIHLKQIVKGEFDCWGDRYSIWKGKKFNLEGFIDYYDLPWEIEAHELENKRY